MDPGQIEYITVQAGDEVEVNEKADQGFFASIGAAISNFFTELAYLFS